jgi:hypothetical protein
MHWNLDSVLWALLLAGHLIVLVVLLGRDRAQRFPWFTAAVAVAAARLLIDHLLHGKLTMLAFYWQNYSLLLVSSILVFFVLAELVRPVFGSGHPGEPGKRLKANGWIAWTLLTLLIGVVAVVLIGPWPSWASITDEKALMALRLVWIAALKTDLLVALLAVEVTILLLVFGRRFGFPWRNHSTQIAIGLSTIAIGQYAAQFISQAMVRNVREITEEKRVQILRVLTNIDHARLAVWILALIWWIVWLWRDEPGQPAASEPLALSEPLELPSEALATSEPETQAALEAETPTDPA